MKDEKLRKIVLVGMFAALSYAVFALCNAFFRIPLPGGSAVTIHLGNAVVVIAALLLGGPLGGLSGAIGMTFADLFDPVYIVYAPKTFFLKFCIGIIAGLIAHKIGHITTSTDKKHISLFVILAAVGGLLFNAIFDPVVGYFYKLVIIGKPAAELALTWDIGITALNAGVSVIVSYVVYMGLRPVLIRTGNFFKLS
jgi:uncharacterized membrane protein